MKNTEKIIKKLNEVKLDEYELHLTSDKGQRVTRTTTGVKDKGKTIFHCHECSHSEVVYELQAQGRGRSPRTGEFFQCKHSKMSWMDGSASQVHMTSPLPRWCPLGNFQ